MIKITPESLSQAIAEGLTTQQIAEKFNCSKRTIFRRKKEFRLTVDPFARKTHEEYTKNLEHRSFRVLGKYINSSTPILHECNICEHRWKARPNDIKRGSGCPVCSHKKDYKYLYIIKFSNGMLKVGVTNDPTGRKNLGMPYEIMSWLESDDNTAYDYEQTLLKIIEPYKINTGLLYDGNTETYIIKD